jgi:hypothetical protein
VVPEVYSQKAGESAEAGKTFLPNGPAITRSSMCTGTGAPAMAPSASIPASSGAAAAACAATAENSRVTARTARVVQQFRDAVGAKPVGRT